MKIETSPPAEVDSSVTKRPLVVPLEESDHQKLSEIGKKAGLGKATYARMIIMAAVNNPERFAPALVSQGQ